MANRIISPHTVEVILKPSDRTTACPEEDRCQLELIKNDYPDILQVTENPSTKTQYVHVGLLGINGGCDYQCRVGMVQGGGPIAIGYGSGLWETKLDGCLVPNNTIIDAAPQHLLCGRYVANNGARVALIVLQEESGGNWQVIVERTDAPSPLILRYAIATDGLVVSAALSPDLSTLYVVESRAGSTGLTAATWHRYVYAPLAGSWGRDAYGSVSHPPWTTALASRPWSVDRQGRLAGYWSTTSESTTESYHYPGGYCAESDQEITNWTKTYTHYTDVFGGYWDLSRNGNYVVGSVRRSPLALFIDSNGDPDFTRIVETMTEGTTIITERGEYTWSNQIIDSYARKYLRNTVAIANEALRFSATIGGRSIGGSLYDFGLYRELIASAECDIWLEFRDPAERPWQHVDFTISFESWEYRDGSRMLSVTPGGWAIVVDSAAVQVPGSMDPIVSSTEAQLTGEAWGGWPCPDFFVELSASGMTDSIRHEKSLVWPKSIGSGNFSVLRSFTSFDQESGETVYGVRIQQLNSNNEPVGSPDWHVYRNGVDITSAIGSCTGHSIDQLHAIYWGA